MYSFSLTPGEKASAVRKPNDNVRADIIHIKRRRAQPKTSDDPEMLSSHPLHLIRRVIQYASVFTGQLNPSITQLAHAASEHIFTSGPHSSRSTKSPWRRNLHAPSDPLCLFAARAKTTPPLLVSCSLEHHHLTSDLQHPHRRRRRRHKATMFAVASLFRLRAAILPATRTFMALSKTLTVPRLAIAAPTAVGVEVQRGMKVRSSVKKLCDGCMVRLNPRERRAKGVGG